MEWELLLGWKWGLGCLAYWLLPLLAKERKTWQKALSQYGLWCRVFKKKPTINISFRAVITYIIRMMYLYRYK